MISLDRALIVCFQYGGFDAEGRQIWESLQASSTVWIRNTFPDKHIRGIHYAPYLCARNRAIRDLVLAADPGDFDWVLSIDHDVSVTHPGAENFLSVPGDVVACECYMANPRAWDALDAFHTPFWRARVEVFRQVPPPWFAYPYSPDGCEILDCDCGYFAAKCLAAGFTVAHGGRCSHQPSGTYQRPVGHDLRVAPAFATSLLCRDSADCG
ncbi:MAG TPA: hypothetical protein VMY37_04505 [Thermoguttaceae bacterium]|nr:hypothetical protein [Thermoguttaceae bacterium]